MAESRYSPGAGEGICCHLIIIVSNSTAEGHRICFAFTLHQVPCVPECQHRELFPATTQAIYICHSCQFQQYIALTRMLASSSSSHSLGSFPSFSRVGCKDHACVKLMTKPHWTLHCAALGQSRAAAICKLRFLPRHYFCFWSFNPFFLVKIFSLSLIFVHVSLTCKHPP